MRDATLKSEDVNEVVQLAEEAFPLALCFKMKEMFNQLSPPQLCYFLFHY